MYIKVKYVCRMLTAVYPEGCIKKQSSLRVVRSGIARCIPKYCQM